MEENPYKPPQSTDPQKTVPRQTQPASEYRSPIPHRQLIIHVGGWLIGTMGTFVIAINNRGFRFEPLAIATVVSVILAGVVAVRYFIRVKL